MIFMVIIQLLAQKYESTDGAAVAAAVYIEENVWIVFFNLRCRKYTVVIVLLEVVLEGNVVRTREDRLVCSPSFV